MFYSNTYIEYKDQFNIYNLITKINHSYKLVFNKKKKLFEIINTAKNNQICLNFKHFNQNILNILHFTKVENNKNLFTFIDKNNNKIIQNDLKKSKSKTTDALVELSYYSKRVNHISDIDIKKIIEGKHV